MKNHTVIQGFKDGNTFQVIHGGSIVGVIKNKGNYFIGQSGKYGFSLRGEDKIQLAKEMVEKFLSLK